MTHVETFFDLSIDPVLASQWTLTLQTQFDHSLMDLGRMFKRATRDLNVLATFNPFDDPRPTYPSLPGGFKSDNLSSYAQESGILNYLVDGNDVFNALTFVFNSALIANPTSFKKKDLGSIPFCSTAQLINLMRFKASSTPINSLLWILSQRLLDSCGSKSSLLRFDSGMIALLKGLWSQFVSQIRTLCDAGLFIPGVDVLVYDEHDDPTDKIDVDRHHVLLHQKLCMLNCCLYLKTGGLLPTVQVREAMNDTYKASWKLDSPTRELFPMGMMDTISGIADMALSQTEAISSAVFNPKQAARLPLNVIVSKHSLQGPSKEGTSWKSDKSWFHPDLPRNKKMGGVHSEFVVESPLEEYFDAESWDPHVHTTPDMSESFIQISPGSNSKLPKQDLHPETSASHPRDGNLRQTELVLLKTGEALWEPVTQLAGFMCEDMIGEQETLYTSLGATSEGTQIRAKMQSLHLISDMEAFKAANPGACVEDFVRWHSPRDWIETEGVGKLTERMVESGNLWNKCWKVRCNFI